MILGILKGLGITCRHVIETYTQDIRDGKKRYYTKEGVALRSSTKVNGIFSIQYPEEKLPVPENFRVVPMLVYDTGENGEQKLRCTACGICAKVCPPQCIWITRATDPETGKPLSHPVEFNIDIDICMNCGLCAEFCPFDSIKMDHDYEIASYERMKSHIYDLKKLAKPVSYYAQIHPVNYAAEEAEKAAKAAAKAAKTA
jgi:NADH-quinone oxidoreductase subunit I